MTIARLDVYLFKSENCALILVWFGIVLNRNVQFFDQFHLFRCRHPFRIDA